MALEKGLTEAGAEMLEQVEYFANFGKLFIFSVGLFPSGFHIGRGQKKKQLTRNILIWIAPISNNYLLFNSASQSAICIVALQIKFSPIEWNIHR